MIHSKPEGISGISLIPTGRIIGKTTERISEIEFITHQEEYLKIINYRLEGLEAGLTD